METWCFDSLILSDLHLGAEVSRARDAVRLLQATRFRRLILLGDIFCDLNFARLKKDHWRFLSCIRKLSNPKRHVEVVWVEGNHDRGLSNVMSHLVGVRVYYAYEWEFAGKRFLAIHGHQFDRWFINNGFLSKIGTWVYLELQKLDSKHQRLSRLLDRMNTAWLRLSPKVCAGAIALARRRGANVVVCGHTHHAMSAGHPRQRSRSLRDREQGAGNDIAARALRVTGHRRLHFAGHHHRQPAQYSTRGRA